MDHKIPRVMGTQHPDNVAVPKFAKNAAFSAEDELAEMYFTLHTLGCDEQMWDAEGKETDGAILARLFADPLWQKKIIGRDVRITFRLPNPRLEKTNAKMFGILLEQIPYLADHARAHNPRSPVPIFEVILPQTETARELQWVMDYYRTHVVKKEKVLGTFLPKKIQVIPLFESTHTLLNAGKIVAEFLKKNKSAYQRVFLARSDPALHSGMLANALAIKVALYDLRQLAKKIKIPIYPILGAGGASFRGRCTPKNILNVWNEYPGIQTITAQSSFKYDTEPAEVGAAIQKIRAEKMREPNFISATEVKEFLRRYEPAYQKTVTRLAEKITAIAPHIPKRRRRFSHTAYGRKFGTRQLPRAISFVASLYSLGLPPELFGLESITKKDAEHLDAWYPSWRTDITAATPFLDSALLESKKIMQELQRLGISILTPNKKHLEIVKKIKSTENKTELPSLILQAARIRNFLG